MKKQLGISFIELIFTLSVAGILVSVGIPGFVGSMRNSDMSSAANSLVGAVHSARAEAVKSRSRVTVCRGDRTGTTPSCSAGGKDLLVFINADNDNTLDGADTLVRATTWLKDDMSILAPDFPNYVSVNARGVTEAINGDSISGTILLCGPTADKHARVVTLSPTGRPTVQHHREATNPPSCATT